MAKKQEKTIEQYWEEALVLREKMPYTLPPSWCWAEFKSLCSVMNGYAFKSSKYSDGGIRIIRITNVQDGFIEDNKPVYYSQTDIKGLECYLLKENDILVSLTGNVGRVATMPKNMLPAALNQRVACLRPTILLNQRYVYYYLLSGEFRKNCLGSAKGIAQQNMSTEAINALAFPLAPLGEQRRIVDAIEKQFAKLDEAKDLIQKSLDSFADRRSAILHKAFTGELTKKWREKHLVDNTAEISNYLNISNFQELSLGWIKINAQDACCEKISCGHTPTQDLLEQGEIPFLKVYNIVDNKIDFEYRPQFINQEINNKLKSSELEPNDIVMNIVGPPLRKIAIIPETYKKWNMNQAIVRFRAKEYIIPKYLYYLLLWPNTLDEVISKTKGVVGQANISVTQSRNLDFIIPSRQEQEEIVRILDLIFEKEDKSKELIDMLDKIDEMKKAILARAFRGELGTANPADEPAAELLRKILEKRYETE